MPKEIDFPRYKMKYSGKNVILRGIFRVVSCFPQNFMLFRGSLDYFSDNEYIRNCHSTVCYLFTIYLST